MTTSGEPVDLGRRPQTSVSERRKPLVWLMDPLCFTPWYTSALAQGLKQEGARVRLICSPFLQEPDYFARMGLKPNEGLLSFSRFAGSCSKLSLSVVFFY